MLPSLVGSDLLPRLVPRGGITGRTNGEVRLPAESYRALVAATNSTQTMRKMLESSPRRQAPTHAVLGTPNRLEYDQGFFVKLGDGAADVKPIAHLYKTQVYQLATLPRHPRGRARAKTDTDTYSLPQSAGGVLLLPSLREARSLPVRATTTASQPEAVAVAVHLAPDDVLRVFRRHRAEATDDALPAPPNRSLPRLCPRSVTDDYEKPVVGVSRRPRSPSQGFAVALAPGSASHAGSTHGAAYAGRAEHCSGAIGRAELPCTIVSGGTCRATTLPAVTTAP